jgi:hypothetical protein
MSKNIKQENTDKGITINPIIGVIKRFVIGEIKET